MVKSAESPEGTTAAGVTREPYFLVNHIGQNRLMRSQRKLRAGFRRQGILLSDGTRIRKRGRRKYNVVTVKAILANWEQIFDLLDRGIIEILDPVTERPIHVDELSTRLEAPMREAPTPPASEENGADAPAVAPAEGYTEEQLLSLSRKALNRVAVREFRVKEPEKLPNKAAVIEAIMAAGQE